jgi:hypothetical protein
MNVRLGWRPKQRAKLVTPEITFSIKWLEKCKILRLSKMCEKKLRGVLLNPIQLLMLFFRIYVCIELFRAYPSCGAQGTFPLESTKICTRCAR